MLDGALLLCSHASPMLAVAPERPLAILELPCASVL